MTQEYHENIELENQEMKETFDVPVLDFFPYSYSNETKVNSNDDHVCESCATSSAISSY